MPRGEDLGPPISRRFLAGDPFLQGQHRAALLAQSNPLLKTFASSFPNIWVLGCRCPVLGCWGAQRCGLGWEMEVLVHPAASAAAAAAPGRVCASSPVSLFPSSDCGFPPSPGPDRPGSHPSPSVPCAATPSRASSAPAARGSWRTTSRREEACVSSTCPTPRTWWWAASVATAFWRTERTVTAGRWRYGAGCAAPIPSTWHGEGSSRGAWVVPKGLRPKGGAVRGGEGAESSDGKGRGGLSPRGDAVSISPRRSAPTPAATRTTAR